MMIQNKIPGPAANAAINTAMATSER